MSGRVLHQRCPLCEAAAFREERVADCSWHALYRAELPPEIRWLRCESCAHVFSDGYFSPEQFAALLSRTPDGQTPGLDASASREPAARMVARVNAMRLALGASPPVLAAAPGSWLDVGFGNGALLTTAAEFGYSTCGLDLRADHVEKLRALGFTAHCLDLTHYQPETPPDVISLCDVLEHMPFPKPALLKAHSLCTQGSLLLVSMPNIDSFVWQQLDREAANPYWGELEHLHNFGRARLYSLLRECGFEPCSYAVSDRYLACMEVIARRL